MNYEEALNFIHGRTKFKKHPNLNTIKLLLKKLNNPQDKINGIHIAGTNGKGSTLAFLRNIFQAEGLKVGSFTSPFLIRFNERISVNGMPISDKEIVDLVSIIQPIVKCMDEELEHGGPTEFEIVTAMMFLYFAKHPVDIVLVEVGLGGLLDSTNVFKPKVSVITTIGYDHMKILGNTLGEIANQKAGIIKNNVDCVIGKLPSEALEVIKNVCYEQKSNLFVPEQDYFISDCNEKSWKENFSFSNNLISIDNLSINMLGQYQIDNAACAIETYIRYKKNNYQSINYKIIREGLINTFWAGRFEKLNDKPTVVIDGAHNEPAVLELSKLLKHHFSNNEIYIVLAILSDKQYLKMINTLANINNVHLILTEFSGPENRKSAALNHILEAVNAKHPVKFVPKWKIAIMKSVNEMSNDDLLLITGSLYFISDVRKLFY
ncbi:bifunctional folylpolyglutamate synthase/dihydrofolate synthase [Apilactobacillus quenuiae]|uniref:bifunctional folylpolyglutamate synthase/dihydrofolate synthase n=1 Tax=Apilactobacillus quenuiae TaxID=2008377 RepID=UPI000D0206D7|nr:folylpolyglutamate synthase/dihydrofolate synthase family protein [Apilactobacillus quenuiae]